MTKKEEMWETIDKRIEVIDRIIAEMETERASLAERCEWAYHFSSAKIWKGLDVRSRRYENDIKRSEQVKRNLRWEQAKWLD